jgi:hypothetical protein
MTAGSEGTNEGKHGCGKLKSPEAWDSVWPGTDRCGRSASCRTAGSAAQCYCSAGQRWTAPSLPLPVHKDIFTILTISVVDPDPGGSKTFGRIRKKLCLIRIRAPSGPK